MSIGNHTKLEEEVLAQAMVVLQKRQSYLESSIYEHCKTADRKSLGFSDRRRSSRRFSGALKPASRRISYVPDMEAAIEHDDHPQVKKEILNNNWKLYDCSPLYNIPSSNDGISDFFADLSTKLCYRIRSLYHEVSSLSLDRVNGLRGCLDDSTALKLQVFKKKNTLSPDLIVYFIGVHAKEIVTEYPVERLPVVLVSKQSELTKIVLESLQECFDCIIRKQNFDEDEFLWMLAIWSGIETDLSKDDPIVLKCSTPNTSGCESIELLFDQETLRNLWEKIHDKTELEFRLHERDEFYDSLYSVLVDTYGISFKNIIITGFVFPSVSANRNGEITIKDEALIMTILRYLSDICEYPITSSFPRLGNEIDIFTS